MNDLEQLDFAELSEEELKTLKEAEDMLNSHREDQKVFLMALTQ